MHVLFVILGQKGSAPPAITTMKNPPMGQVTCRRIFKGLQRYGSPHHSTSSLTSAFLTASIAPVFIVVAMIAEARASDWPWSACLGLGPRRAAELLGT